jgi:ABC-type transporter MlaC component
MPRISLVILLAATLLALTGAAQAPDPQQQQQQEVLELVKEVQAQQTQIVANQDQIEAKLAELAETMRVARIFSRRSH